MTSEVTSCREDWADLDTSVIFCAVVLDEPGQVIHS